MDANPYEAPAAPIDYAPAPVIVTDRPAYFPVSIVKLVVLGVLTFGLYELAWFYQNWKLIKQRDNSDIQPFWRAVFGVFFCHRLFRDIGQTAATQTANSSFPASSLATVWILLTVAARLPDPFWLLSLVSIAPLVVVQRTVNQINTQVAPGHDPNSRWTASTYLTVIFGGGFTLLVLIGLMIPGK